MTWILGLGCLLQLLTAAFLLRAIFAVRSLDDADDAAPAEWPSLSVVIPACNEAETIEAALATLLAQRYPRLELVVVDDRSTDATPALLARFAATDARLKVIRVAELPEGWLGKVHALARGLEASSGEYVLFTDADVHFGADCLERAMAHVTRGQLDHLAVLPRIRARSWLLEAVVCGFGAGFLVSTRPHAVGRSRAFTGIGAFNLVRREALAKTPGLEWLRMEVADDVGLGLMLHRHGARKGFLTGGARLSVEWYPSLSALVRGFEKNAFGVFCSWRYARVPGLVLTLLWLACSPLLALGTAAWPLAVSTVAVQALAYHAVGTISGGRALARLLAPYTGPVLAWATLRAAVLCARQGGARWRGTLYPREALRAGQRVSLRAFVSS